MSTGHGHDHHHPRPNSALALRARALEALLAEKGLVATDAIDAVVELYERTSARRTAPRWWRTPGPTRPTASGCWPTVPAIAELGFGGAEGDILVAVENTPTVHNVVVCTLCSCYPWPVLGLPPTWYKSPPTALAWWPSRARCCASSAWSCPTRSRSGSGIQRRGPLPGRADAARRHRRLAEERLSRSSPATA